MLGAMEGLYDVYNNEGKDDKILSNLLKKAMLRLVEINTQDSLTVTSDELNLARDVGKITAIKAYRERTKANLLDSKNAIEEAAEEQGIQFKE